MGRAKGSQPRDDPADGGSERARRDQRSLLDRAGVIGADSIASNDPGNPFIPAADAPSTDQTPDAATLDDWSAAGVPDDEIERWASVGATPTTAATLRRLGVDPEAVGAAPVSADELVGWLWHGFEVHEVSDWLPFGPVRAAARRRDAGLAPGEG